MYSWNYGFLKVYSVDIIYLIGRSCMVFIVQSDIAVESIGQIAAESEPFYFES